MGPARGQASRTQGPAGGVETPFNFAPWASHFLTLMLALVVVLQDAQPQMGSGAGSVPKPPPPMAHVRGVGEHSAHSSFRVSGMLYPTVSPWGSPFPVFWPPQRGPQGTLHSDPTPKTPDSHSPFIILSRGDACLCLPVYRLLC